MQPCWQVRASRALNRRLGGREGEMLCTRIYRNSRTDGGLWIAAEGSVNVLFLLLRLEWPHVRRTYVWEMRYGKTPTHQGAARSSKKTPEAQQANTALLEAET